jgi:pimeloyl-ACP methyl ester carboxylesterase
MKSRKHELARRLRSIFLLAMPFVGGFGCGGNPFVFPEPETNPATNSFVTHTGTFSTSSAEYRADFGTISVPENRQDSASRLIHIPVIRIHARSRTEAEPIFGLSGGPGTSNMTWMPPDSLIVDHDFVMVGYRGVDGSIVLDCPEVEKAMKTRDDLLSEQSLMRIADAWKTSAKRLTDEGVDLDGYTIQEVIEDMEAVRTALGYQRINLLSESYGTRMAYFYGVIHPASIHRSVMIGVNPPGRFVWDPQTTDSLITYYARLWSQDPVMSTRTPHLDETMRSVLHNMPGSWLFFSINPGKVRIVTFAMLFQRTTAAMVFDAYVAAEKGDPSGLALMSIAADYIFPSMITWGDLASKAVSADFDSTREYIHAMMPPECILGSPLSRLLWGPLHYARWPIHPLPSQYRIPQRSEIETLLLSGNIDFSTPSAFAAKELLPYLPSGRQIVLREYGHVGDVWSVNPTATQRMLVSFFETGIPDTSLNRYAPLSFEVTQGFPVIAKTALGMAAVLPAALVGGILWWVN